MRFPAGEHTIEIFKSIPPANADTYKKGAPIEEKTSQSKAVIFYAANLQNIGVIDNTDSDATTTYQKSISTGFTFTAEQSITTESSIEFSVEFVKASFTLSVSLTFSQQWSSLTTETYTFEVGPGKKAFTYQGYTRAIILGHNHGDNTFAWVGVKGNFLSPALATTRKPLVS